MDAKIEDLFFNGIEVCNKMAHNLRFSLDKVNVISPFTKENLDNITDENKQLVDAFIHRFGKLQDFLGDSMFRIILELEAEKIGSMRDILNKMEKFYIIDNVDEWVSIRKAGNDAVYDYDLKSETIAEKLNNLVAFTTKLFRVLVNIEEYAAKKLQLKK